MASGMTMATTSNIDLALTSNDISTMTMTTTQPWMDHFHASLNPCSLETIPLPVTLGNGRKVWPLMLSCYQLDGTGEAPVVAAQTTPTAATSSSSSQTASTTNTTAAAETSASGTNSHSIAAAASGNNATPPRSTRRRGRVDFYAIAVPDLESNQPTLPLSFGNPYNVLGEENQEEEGSTRRYQQQQQQQQFSVGGVLDGKWAPIHSSSSAFMSQYYSWAFATAHSTGEIQIHSFQVPKVNINNNNDNDDLDENVQLCTTTTSPSPAFTIRKCIGQSAKPPRENYNQGSAATTTTTIRPLCLSVNWANKQINHHHHHQEQQHQQEQFDFKSDANNNDDHDHHQLSQIVSTYSNGKVAIHDVAFLSSHMNCSFNSNDSSDGVDANAALRAQVIERDSWHAHSMFTSPAEVWSADFCNSNNNSSSNTTMMILSCGDEGKIKFWDTRGPTRPVQVVEPSPFDAGATCAAAHPRKPNVVAVGSYDETVCLYDVRYFQHSSKGKGRNSNSRCLGQSKALGGGIWRIKWHPYSDNRLLVAAMHCGCRVLKLQALSGGGDGQDEDDDALHRQQHDPFLHETIDSPAVSIKPIKKFTQHESMAYGADWLVCRHPTQNGYFEAAASCSFYDRSVFLWDSVVV